MDIQEYNNFIMALKKNIGNLKQRVVEIKQRLIDSNNEDASEIQHRVDANTKEFQMKSLENIENALRDSQQRIEEAKELPCLDINAHPFTRNTLVLSTIFGFLNGNSLKQCRLVNYSWNENCSQFFKTQIQISISDPERFLLDFNRNNSKLDCGRYKFQSNLIISDFQEILLQDQSKLTSLTLKGVQFYDNFGRLGSCNLNELLGGKDICLKKLDCDSGGLVIPIEKLAEIEYLDLRDCKIIFPEGYGGKISSPKYFRLVNTLIIRPTGEKVEEIRVDRLFKLRKVKQINIDQNDSLTLLHLCLEERVEEMINCVRVAGEVVLSTSRQLKLKALTLSCLAYEYDLSTNVPESLECLSISIESVQHQNENIRQDSAILPNLIYFYASCCTISPSLLSKLSECSQLKFVHLQSVYRRQFDISWLPPSVETIILGDVRPTFSNENQLHVKDFILIDCDSDRILEILTRIKAENLYLRFKESNRAEQNSQILFQIYQQQYYGKTCKVQSFIWQDHSQFQNSPLFSIVDKRAGSYTFVEGGLGEAADANLRDSNDAFDNTVSLIDKYAHAVQNSLSSVPTPRFPHFFKPNWKYTH